MAQKADLRQAMRSKANPAAQAVKEPPASGPVLKEREARTRPRPGRVGKTNITGFFPASVKKQLRLMAAEKETTIQALLTEALNDLFAKHGKPEIAAPLEEEG